MLLLQALLDAGTEYGWGQPACEPGSIAKVIHLLQGRVDLIGSETKNAPVAQNIEEYEKLLKKMRDGGGDVIRAELQIRLIEYCASRDLVQIYEMFQEGEDYDYYVDYFFC